MSRKATGGAPSEEYLIMPAGRHFSVSSISQVVLGPDTGYTASDRVFHKTRLQLLAHTHYCLEDLFIPANNLAGLRHAYLPDEPEIKLVLTKKDNAIFWGCAFQNQKDGSWSEIVPLTNSVIPPEFFRAVKAFTSMIGLVNLTEHASPALPVRPPRSEDTHAGGFIKIAGLT